MIVEDFTFVKLEVVVTGLVDVVVIEVAGAGEAAVVVENITIFFPRDEIFFCFNRG